MKTINNFKTLSLTSGVALVLSVASGSVLAADSNPFGITKLNQGYQVAMNEGKCGEGKCGESKTMKTEGKCGGSKTEKTEGKCGGSNAKDTEGKCGGSKAKKTEGKCGEGKCGGKN